MKDKKILIGIGVLALVLLLGGVIVLVTKKQAPQQASQMQQEEVVQKISADEIGFTLTAGADGKRVVMTVSKTEGLSAIDYELSYTSKGGIPRGAIGHVDIKSPGQVVRQEIVLGTCSDVCHYDQEVSNIKLVLKVTKTDGKVYQTEKTLEL